MVYAPDSGRLRSLFARPFHRSHAFRDRLLRREPSFGPDPRALRREPAVTTPSVLLERASPRSSRLDAAGTRYALPAAPASEAFGPYARSAEAELSTGFGDEPDGFTAAKVGTERRANLAPRRESASGPHRLAITEDTNKLIVRLSRALSAVAPEDEKISVDLLPIVTPESRATPSPNSASVSDRDIKVMKCDEQLADKNSTISLDDGAAAMAKRLRPPCRNG